MTTRSLAAALLLVVALALGACGGTDTSISVDGLEIEGGADGLTIAADGQTIEAQGGDAKVPDDFPASIPLPDGKLTSALKTSADGKTAWTLTYEGDAAAYDAYISEIVNETGQESTFSMDQEGLKSQTFAIDGHDVTAQAIEGLGITVLVQQQ